MDFSSGIFAFFVGDFRFPELKIGDVKFCYDSNSEDFIVKGKPDLKYSKKEVLDNPDFMVFREFSEKDEDGEEVITVERYEMQVD